MFSKIRKIAIFAAIPLMISLTACSDDDNNPITPITENANVRVIHASYDAPAVDIAINDAKAISNLAYPISSGYAELNAGPINVKVTPAGASTPVVIDADLTLEENKDYTVFAAGSLANIEPIVVEDSRETNSSKARIRFAHFSPDAPAVDIKLNDGNGATVFGDAAFKNVTSYAEVDAGSYIFAVTPAGANDVVVRFNPIPVENGKVYTVVAHGTLDANDNFPFSVRVFIDNDGGDGSADLSVLQLAKVLVVHASPDAPGVDLLVDDQLAGANLEFSKNTGYLEVPAGTRNVKVNVSNTTTTVIEANLDLLTDGAYTVFAIDSVSNISALVLQDDLTAPAAGNAHARFVHLSPNAPAVDITLTDGTVVFGNTAFTENTAFTPLLATTYDLQVRLAGTNTVVLSLPGITLENGKIYTVFAKGFVGGAGSQALGAEIIVNN